MSLEIDRIYCGDCLDFMKEMPDKSVDLVLTDPPYGIGEAAGKNKTRGGPAFGNPTKIVPARDYGFCEWDNMRLEGNYLSEMARISKNQIIFGGNYYADRTNPIGCGVQGAVAMTFRPAGEARLDLYTDAMLLDIGPDTFVVPLDRLADLTAHRRREVVVSRRYWGDAPGAFRDIEQGVRLRRSQTDRSLMLTEQGRVYSIPVYLVLELRDTLMEGGSKW